VVKYPENPIFMSNQGKVFCIDLIEAYAELKLHDAAYVCG